MSSVTLEEAQQKLSELISQLHPGEEVLITQAERTVARLIRAAPEQNARCPGSAVGKLTVVAEDGEHLEDFQEYMP